MLYQIDRVQKIVENNKEKYHIFEFIKVNNVKEVKYYLDQTGRFGSRYFDDIDKSKLRYLLVDNNFRNFVIHIIVYNEYTEGSNYLVARKEYQEDGSVKKYKWLYTFEELKGYFIDLNNKNLTQKCKSKKLGSQKDVEDNSDEYVNDILGQIYNIQGYNDDCGIELTKQLLGQNPTTGIDLDLFQYIDSTKECIIFEFLKRDNKYITNKSAHPMRYCWTNGDRDNKQKFISLWGVKEILGGKLYLINYSSNKKEEISILEILELTNEKGIRHEKKYIMKYYEFVNWLKRMNNYSEENNDYLKGFDYKEYDSEYFDNFNENKNYYGTDKEKIQNIKEVSGL